MISAALLAAVFLASLAGSLHCVGMCGGLASFAAHNRTGAALYHLSRGAAYLVLGATAGALGAAIDFGGEALGWSRAAMFLAGLTMIGVGVAALLRRSGRRLPKLPLPAWLSRVFARGHRWAAVQAPEARALWLGALTALLPCGWLYAFVLVAAGAGSATAGALVMAAFWAGTVPALLVAALGARALLRPLGRRAPTLGAWALVALGFTALATRAQVPAFAGRVAAASSVAEIRALGETTPACCVDPADPADEAGE